MKSTLKRKEISSYNEKKSSQKDSSKVCVTRVVYQDICVVSAVSVLPNVTSAVELGIYKKQGRSGTTSTGSNFAYKRKPMHCVEEIYDADNEETGSEEDLYSIHSKTKHQPYRVSLKIEES